MVPQGPTPSNAPLPQSVALEHGRAGAVADVAIAGALRILLQHEVAAWPQLGFEVVKARPVRLVLRGRLGEVPVHAKVFRPDKLSDRARDALRGPRGARELANLQRARALGLPVVQPLAAGMAVEDDQLRSFVITRTLPDATPFAFGMPAAVLARVGALLRSMHDRGYLPGDLHAGNLLVARDGAPYLLDLTSVRHRGDASLSQRATALAFLCHELDGGALDPRAAPLLAAYRDAGAALPEGLARELAFATHRWRAAALPAFGRRCARNCRHTEVPPRQRGAPRWHWHLGAGGETEALRQACRDLVASPPSPGKTGRRGSVWVMDRLVMKERDQGAARKLWRAAYWLSFAGVATAPAVALCTFRGRGFVFARRLDRPSLAAELGAGALSTAAIATAARSLGTMVGRLHAHGLRNRDLKFDNLVRDPDGGEVCMVDLDGVSRNAVTDTRSSGADLGRLLAAFEAADQPGGAATLRTFLRAYVRSHRRLLQEPQLRRLLPRARQRAGEWAAAHAAR